MDTSGSGTIVACEQCGSVRVDLSQLSTTELSERLSTLLIRSDKMLAAAASVARLLQGKLAQQRRHGNTLPTGPPEVGLESVATSGSGPAPLGLGSCPYCALPAPHHIYTCPNRQWPGDAR